MSFLTKKKRVLENLSAQLGIHRAKVIIMS